MDGKLGRFYPWKYIYSKYILIYQSSTFITILIYLCNWQQFPFWLFTATQLYTINNNAIEMIFVRLFSISFRDMLITFALLLRWQCMSIQSPKLSIDLIACSDFVATIRRQYDGIKAEHALIGRFQCYSTNRASGNRKSNKHTNCKYA